MNGSILRNTNGELLELSDFLVSSELLASVGEGLSLSNSVTGVGPARKRLAIGSSMLSDGKRRTCCGFLVARKGWSARRNTVVNKRGTYKVVWVASEVAARGESNVGEWWGKARRGGK
jgi:hypothetical protein